MIDDGAVGRTLGGMRLVLLCLVPILALLVVHLATAPLRASVAADAAVIVTTPTVGDAAQRAAALEEMARAEGVPGIVALDRIRTAAVLVVAIVLGSLLEPRLSPGAVTNGLSAIAAGLVLGLWSTDRASLYSPEDWRLIALAVGLATAAHLVRRRWIAR